MKTTQDLQDALNAALGLISYTKTLGPDSNTTAYTFAGDGVGFGSLTTAVSLGYIVPAGRNDLISGAGGNDNLKGYGGADVLVGNAGSDVLFGGPGSYATTFTIDGNNFIFGDSQSVDPNFSTPTDGADLIGGGTGSNDYLFGGGGDDTLYGGNFANAINAGNNYLSGGPGDDLLIAGNGNDTIDGGPGVDIAAFRGVLTLGATAVSSYTIRPSDQAPGEFSIVGPDGTDLVSNVENLEMKPPSSATSTASPSFDTSSPTYNLPQAAFTLVIHRYRNGDGYLVASIDGASAPYLTVGSADATLPDNSLLRTANPRLMNSRVVRNGGGSLVGFAPLFAYDDLTPIPQGTYNAFLHTGATHGIPTNASPNTDLQLEIITPSSGPSREAIDIHVGNWTSNSAGCYVMGSANLRDLLKPIVDAAANIPVTKIDGGGSNDLASTVLSSIGLDVISRNSFKMMILPTANADIVGTSTGLSPDWVSAIQVQVVDNEPISQPTLSFGVLRDLGVANGKHLYGVDLNLSHIVSKDIRVTLSLSGPGTLDPGPVLIQGGSPKGEIRFSVPDVDDNPASQVSLSIIEVRPAQAAFNSESATSAPGARTYGDLNKILELFGGPQTKSFALGQAIATSGPIVTPTGYGGTSYILLSRSDAASVVDTFGFDSVTVAFSADGNTPLQAFSVPPGIEEVAVSGSTSLVVQAVDGTLNLSGGDGNDTIISAPDAVLAGGAGADVFEGTLANLDGAEISDFELDDRILVLGVSFDASAVTLSEGSTDISIDPDHTGTPVSRFSLDASLSSFTALGYTLNVAPTAEGTALTFEPACYLPGTMIATPHGQVPVEQLAPGDLVITLAGAARPVIWIGVGRALATRGRRSPATPVIIRKGALGPNVPFADLRVTKGHAMYFNGTFVPVEFLVNHRSILWDDRAQEVTVFHVELETHDVLFANGAPAESYRDDGNRWLFQNANSGWDQPPKGAFAPVLTGGPIVDAIWRDLLERAGPRPGVPVTDDPDLHLIVDEQRVDGKPVSGAIHLFRLASPPGDVRIVSRSGSPSELGLARDPRVLGVALRRVVLWQGARTRVLDASDPSLNVGFHLFEEDGGFRWTDGDARLPPALFADLHGPFDLELHLGCTTQYLLWSPQTGAIAA